jgi:hypothetical protein
MATRTLLSAALAALGASALAMAACAPADDDPLAIDEGSGNEVKVDTRSPAARRQYDANVAFATAYAARCARTNSGHPRVLLTGFGRFMDITNNATGRIVSAVVPDAIYPETAPPAAGEVDPPEPQLSVATRTLVLPGVGPVEICAMILPVY